MRCGGNIKPAIGKTGVGRKPWTEFHKELAVIRVNLNRPGSASGVVQKVWTQRVGAIGDLTNKCPLVAEGWELESIAEASLRECLKKVRGGGENLCDWRGIRSQNLSQNKSQSSKAPQGK
jgi:hypothetical protein